MRCGLRAGVRSLPKRKSGRGLPQENDLSVLHVTPPRAPLTSGLRPWAPSGPPPPLALSEAEQTFRGPESASGRSLRRPGQHPGTRLRVSGPNQRVSEPLATAAGGVPRAPPPTSQRRLPAALRGGRIGSGGSLTVRAPASPRGHLILGRRGEALRGPASDSSQDAPIPHRRQSSGRGAPAPACDVSARTRALSGGGREGPRGRGQGGAKAGPGSGGKGAAGAAGCGRRGGRRRGTGASSFPGVRPGGNRTATQGDVE